MAKTEKKHIRKKRGYSIEQAARLLKRCLIEQVNEILNNLQLPNRWKVVKT